MKLSDQNISLLFFYIFTSIKHSAITFMFFIFSFNAIFPVNGIQNAASESEDVSSSGAAGTAITEEMSSEVTQNLLLLIHAGMYRYIPFEKKSPDPLKKVKKDPPRSDRIQSGGVWYSLRSNDASGRMFFNINGGLFADYGVSKNISENNGHESSGKTEISGSFLPGDNLYSGFRFCPEMNCSIFMGRFDYTDAEFNGSHVKNFFKSRLNPDENKNLANIHGTSTGIGLKFYDSVFGTIYLIPFHEHHLSGSYVSGITGTDPEPQDISYGMDRFSRDKNNVRSNPESRGHSILYSIHYSYFIFSFLYNINLQKETSSHPDSFSGTFDRIEYTGIAAGTAGSNQNHEGNVFINLERSHGYYRSVSRNSEGSYEERIDGLLVRFELNYRFKTLFFTGNFSLPETRTVSNGPFSGLRDKSGYAGYGNSLLHSPLLRGSLNYASSPALCHDRMECTGLYINPSELEHSDHSGIVFLQFSAKLFSTVTSLSAERAVPLRERRDGKKNPFKSSDKMPGSSRLTEFSLSISPYEKKKYSYHIEYSRLLRENPEQKKHLLAGESFSAMYTAAF